MVGVVIGCSSKWWDGRWADGKMDRRGSGSLLWPPGEGVDRPDQPEMAEGLREIAGHAAGPPVVLLGHQLQIVGAVQGALHHLDRIVLAAHAYVLLDQPEAADQERVLITRQAVLALGEVAQHE